MGLLFTVIVLLPFIAVAVSIVTAILAILVDTLEAILNTLNRMLD